MKLPTLTKVQPEVEVQSEELEEEFEGESTESLVRDEDFEVFYHQDKTEDVAFASISSTVVVSEGQGAINVPEAMVIEKKLPDLLSLLESHTEGATPEITVVPKLLTLALPPPTQTEPVDKKQKRDKKGGKGSTDEKEIQEETPLKQAKIVKVTRSQQRREGETSEVVPERCPRIPNWNPLLLLDGSPLLANSSICNFDNKREGYVVDLVE